MTQHESIPMEDAAMSSFWADPSKNLIYQETRGVLKVFLEMFRYERATEPETEPET